MGYYCSACKCDITARVYDFSMDRFGKALCIQHQRSQGAPPKPSRYPEGTTPQAIKLYEALRKRGIKCKLEHKDGYKTVDISIGWARWYLEIEGRRHLHSPKQLYADLERDYWSDQDGFRTTRITNAMVDENVEGIADSIAKVARRRFDEEKDEDEEEDEDESW